MLADSRGNVIAGHGRLAAAQSLGLDTVPVVILDHLSEAQRRAYILDDNRLALNAGWDDETLAAELHALNGEGFALDLIGFSVEELDALMAPLDEEGEGRGQTPPARSPCLARGDQATVWAIGSSGDENEATVHGTTVIAAETTGRICFGTTNCFRKPMAERSPPANSAIAVDNR